MINVILNMFVLELSCSALLNFNENNWILDIKRSGNKSEIVIKK